MKKKFNINNLKSREIVAGFHGKFINSHNMTWAFWEIEQNSSIPEHSHFHEQIMVTIEKLTFSIQQLKSSCKINHLNYSDYDNTISNAIKKVIE